MNAPPAAGRRLLYRSFIIVIIGLLAIGLILDQFFLRAQAKDDLRQQQQFLEGSFVLIERSIRNAPENLWHENAAELAHQLNTSISVIPADQASMPSSLSEDLENGETIRLYDNDDRPAYYRRLELTTNDDADDRSKAMLVIIGPFDEVSSSNGLRKFLSPLYYIAVFLLIWCWLRPLVRDVELLNNAAHRIGADYNASTPELGKISTLTVLSDTFSDMAMQLKSMILSQKEMTNALSHELRTPLSRIKFSMAVLDERVDDEVRQELHRISDDVGEIDTLIDKMLKYARLEHADLTISPVNIDVNLWLTALYEKNRHSNLDQHWKFSIAGDASMLVADQELLTLAMSNLLANAIRYAHKTIEIDCHRISRNFNGWRLSVSDDGHGIPDEDLEDVFKAFTRIDESRDRKTGGYGLGLAIVDRITRLHHGYCSASKSPLGGACLSMCIPDINAS